ncbi:IPT/TIG domain-containing protein [Mucilaginibacter sp. OK098]|uniref:IPT/TIG domain-containing protein n=1 Tax=Mucilaginibacter sp. OK098 TaxID=1855297 RepID=UPI0009F81FC7|nr:IPT/TIG domain-containing protein [Mucilaginibacter sp. OK098]
MIYKHIKSGSVIRILVFLTVSFLISCSKKTADTPNKPVAITSLSVNTGPYNTSVTINGTGFSAAIAEDKVLFNGKPAEIKAASATKIIATVPVGAGTGVVSVSVKDATAVPGPVFTYQFTAVVSAFVGSGKSGYDDGQGAAASFSTISSLEFDADDNLYVTSGNAIRKVSPDGLVTTLAGSSKEGSDDGKGAAASFKYPQCTAIDAAHNIYVGDTENRLIRKISPDGDVTTISGHIGGGYADGKLSDALYVDPDGMAFDKAGNLFVSDGRNNVIRKISTDGIVSTFAGGGPFARGSKDGNGTNATFTEPFSIAFNSSGNLLVADFSRSLIREIAPNADVTTFAGGNSKGTFINGKGTLASFFSPWGVAVDAKDNIYVTDFGNNVIRMITPNGEVSTLVGSGASGAANGPADKASFNSPGGIAIDKSGNIYVADFNYLIRKITLK